MPREFSKGNANPTEDQLRSAEFKALWGCIKGWDINAPEFYEGYCGANGSHVALLLDALARASEVSL